MERDISIRTGDRTRQEMFCEKQIEQKDTDGEDYWDSYIKSDYNKSEYIINNQEIS